MSLSHRQHRTKCAPALKRAISLIVVMGLASLTAQPTLADDLYSEAYTVHGEVLSPEWGSTHYYSLDLPLFDTNNGARTLLAYEVSFDMMQYYTYGSNANPTGDVVGCESSWVTYWKGEVNGQQWFPLEGSTGYLDSGQGYGAYLNPYTDAIPPTPYGSGVGCERVFDDPTLLAQLTGIGTTAIDCTHTLSDITFSAPRRWPGAPGVFVPDLLNVTMDSITADLTVTYLWTPEPTTLAIFGFGVLPLLRRRRR